MKWNANPKKVSSSTMTRIGNVGDGGSDSGLRLEGLRHAGELSKCIQKRNQKRVERERDTRGRLTMAANQNIR